MVVQHPDTARTKRILQVIKETKQTRDEARKTISELPKEAADVGQLVGQEDQPTLGKKLIKTGTFLVVAVPEPFISDITGTALIATGLVMNKLSKRESITDVCKSLRENVQDVERLRREVTRGTFLQG